MEPLVALTSLAVFGVAAQWLSWRMRLPSILLLLLAGLLIGPVTGWINPDELLGDLLFPVVSLSVGLILFEGGLSLGVTGVREAGRVAQLLISVGAAITVVLTTFAAHWLFDIRLGLAALLGAVLVVTGPTVIGPLLAQVRPKGKVGKILRAEGILIDPIGALGAVIVFEILLAGELAAATDLVLLAVTKTLAFGALIGLAGGFLLAEIIGRFMIPDRLYNVLTIAMVLAVFTASDLIQEESGLLAVTIMGIVVASQPYFPVASLLEFNETIQILLISGLFLLLGARVDLGAVADILIPGLILAMFLVLVVRPIAVAASTVGSSLPRKERVFLAAVAPRGIVAAAVASVFAIRLEEEGFPGGDVLAPAAFIVITVTILVAGLGAAPLARRLGLAESNAQGVIMVGADRWARQFAERLEAYGVPVLVVDDDWARVSAARAMGLNTHYGSVLSEAGLAQIDLSGIGRLVAATANDEANILYSQRMRHTFGRENVYQVRPSARGVRRMHAPGLTARLLFSDGVTSSWITERLDRGWTMKATHLSDRFGLDEFHDRYGESAEVLALISEDGQMRLSSGEKPEWSPGDVVIALVEPGQSEPR